MSSTGGATSQASCQPPRSQRPPATSCVRLAQRDAAALRRYCQISMIGAFSQETIGSSIGCNKSRGSLNSGNRFWNSSCRRPSCSIGMHLGLEARRHPIIAQPRHMSEDHSSAFHLCFVRHYLSGTPIVGEVFFSC